MDSSDTPADILARDAVLQPGEEFGEYYIESSVTSGLLGRIYHALHMDNSTSYSICVLPHRASKDSRLGGRLRRYAQQALDLHHPNLVKVDEWKVIRGRFCLVMEPITGRSLQQIRRDKLKDLDEGFDTIGWQTTEEHISGDIVIPSTFGFGEEWTKDVISNLAELLTYLQEKRLAHSALAPDYIFVDSAGRVQSALGGLLSVLGRPLFEVIVSSEIVPVNNQVEEREVTVIDVLSPEVQSGASPTIRSDLYALGILTYWMFSGRQYSGLPTYVPLTKFRPDIAEHWTEIADALLEADPETRLNSPSSLVYRMSELEVNTAATDVTVPQSEKSEEKSEKEGAKKTKKGPLVAIAAIFGLLLILGIGGLVFIFMGSEEEVVEVVPEVVEVVPVAPEWVDVSFQAVSGARVSALSDSNTEIAIGTVPESGFLSVSEILEKGDYQFKFEHEDYEVFETEVYTLGVDEPTNIEAELTPLPSEAEIWTEPSGASIAVDGTIRGESPVRLTNLPSQAPITISAMLEGHRAKTQEITLEPNSGVVIDFGEFEPQRAFIAPKVSLTGENDPAALEQVEIRLGEEVITLSDAGNYELKPGAHILSVSHPDYQPVQSPFEIKDAQEIEINLALNPKPGIVRILGELPAAAKILVNRRSVEFPKTGEVVMAVTPRQEHEIVIEALNYHVYRTSVKVNPNRSQEIVPEIIRIAGPERESPWTLPYRQMEMVWIESGEFTLGSPLPEHARLPNEGPTVNRSIESPYWIGAHEVTQRVYRDVMGDNPSEFEGLENPVDSVSWDDAVEFCEKLTEIERVAGRLPEGFVYRLPTEAEWEYAARGGTNTPYYWGGYAHNGLANFSGVYPRGAQYDGQGRDHYGTIQVGSYSANPWGLFDVHGNVREWTLNVYASKPPRALDLGLDNDSSFLRRTQRGGSWEDLAPACRSASRKAVSPELNSHSVGFRVVLAKLVDSSEN